MGRPKKIDTGVITTPVENEKVKPDLKKLESIKDVKVVYTEKSYNKTGKVDTLPGSLAAILIKNGCAKLEK